MTIWRVTKDNCDSCDYCSPEKHVATFTTKESLDAFLNGIAEEELGRKSDFHIHEEEADPGHTKLARRWVARCRMDGSGVAVDRVQIEVSDSKSTDHFYSSESNFELTCQCTVTRDTKEEAEEAVKKYASEFREMTVSSKHLQRPDLEKSIGEKVTALVSGWRQGRRIIHYNHTWITPSGFMASKIITAQVYCKYDDTL